MSPRRPKGRLLNGVLLLNKASGMTSNSALQQARWIFNAAKAGHTGSLDPLATGILPVCFGESTKFSQYLLDADKRYRSEFCLGVTTTTGDAEGEVIAQKDAGHLTIEKIEQALKKFRGEIEQIPSMYSALKHQGQPLYKLARQGKTIERAPRKVTIHSIEVLAFAPGNPAKLLVDVLCTKGTYIRSIAEDVGQALECGGHVSTLHRTQTGDFSDENAITLDQLREELAQYSTSDSDEDKKLAASNLDHHLLPVDAPIHNLPTLTLPENSIYYFRLGQPVMDSQVYRIAQEGGIVRVFSEAGDFLGIGEVLGDGKISPKRLISEISSPISM